MANVDRLGLCKCIPLKFGLDLQLVSSSAYSKRSKAIGACYSAAKRVNVVLGRPGDISPRFKSGRVRAKLVQQVQDWERTSRGLGIKPTTGV
jgi:hypothetical protein